MNTKNLSKIFIVLITLLVTTKLFSQVQPSNSENYIHIIEPIQENTVADNQTPGIRTVQYFDGLGRLKQTVQVQAAPTTTTAMRDLVTNFEYDDFGRQEKDFLSVPSNQNSGAYVSPSTLNSLYSNYYQDVYGESSTWYSQKQFENSPLNRVLKQAAPGDDWKLGSGKEIGFEYQSNTAADAVKRFKANTSWVEANKIYNISLTQNGTYPVNELYKTITTDENGNKTHLFKNKEGQLILKRSFVSNGNVAGSHSNNPFPISEAIVKSDTYYVYDIYGNLTYVIPPLASAKSNVNAVLSELCYQYRYDKRNRLVEKKIPGKGWEWMVYDKQDRLVATKDAKQVAEGNSEWTFIKYDNLGRVTYTGFVWEQGNRVQVQNWIESNFGSNNSERDATGFPHDNLQIYYKADKGYPTGSFHILTINYYDTYAPSRATDQADFPVLSGVEIRNGSNSSNHSLNGMLTSSVTRAMGTWNFEKTYFFYDIRSRNVWNHKINHLGGYTKTQNNLDFRGKPNSTITFHKYNSSSQEIKVQNNFTYDSQERVKSHIQSINNSAFERIAANTYDGLGQLTYKLVGNRNSLPALQGVDYGYNIRGWLTGINDITNNLQLKGLPGAPMDDIFAFKIQYNDLIYGGETVATPLHNGNISQTFWKSASDNKTRGYSYEYDQMNRLRYAHFNRLSSATQTGFYPGAFDESMAYDLNGNIQHLIRNSEDQYGAEIPMDNLLYTYKNGTANSNQLLKVVDNAASNSAQGFNNGSSLNETDYTYDENGNMTSDKNKNITSIEYNSLNLPIKIKWNNLETRKIEYLYNSAGVKVQKKITNGTVVTTTDYIDGFQYLNGVLQFFPHAEGYVKNTIVNGQNTYDYVYNYTDHLGNIRMSYTKDPQTGDLKILEENHYYPFGFKHKNYANIDYKIDAINNETDKAVVGIDPGNPAQQVNLYKYRYNGKEYQDELGLNMYDMDMRQYDPTIARWVVQDPVIHHSMCPYNAFDNNPAFWMDPSGGNANESIGFGSTNYINNGNGIGLSFGEDGSMTFSGSTTRGGFVDKGTPKGSTSPYWTSDDEAQFDGSDDIYGAENLPAVIANSKQSLNAGLENRAIFANQRWYHRNFGPSISSWDGVRRAPMTWSNSNSYFFGDPGRRIAMGMLQGGADMSVGYGLGKGYKAVGGLFKASNTGAGRLNLFKWGENTTTTANGWQTGDYMLYLPNQGSPKLNWQANYGALRREMGLGNPIYETFIHSDGTLRATGGFLNAERFTLQSRGWIYQPSLGAWMPPN